MRIQSKIAGRLSKTLFGKLVKHPIANLDHTLPAGVQTVPSAQKDGAK